MNNKKRCADLLKDIRNAELGAKSAGISLNKYNSIGC